MSTRQSAKQVYATLLIPMLPCTVDLYISTRCQVFSITQQCQTKARCSLACFGFERACLDALML